MRERNPPADPDGLGVIGKLLNTFNLTPGDLIDKAKDFMAGSSADGIGAVAVKEAGGLLKEIVKRFPLPEDEEEGEEEETPEDEEEPPPKPRRERRVTQNERPQIEQRAEIVDLLTKGRPDADKVPVATSPDLPAVVPVPTPITVPPWTGPLKEAKDGRDAMRALLARIKDRPEADWPPIVTDLATSTTLVTWLAKRGVAVALEEAKSPQHAPALTRVLAALGLDA